VIGIGRRLDHMQRCDPLGMTVGLGQTGIDDEAAAVLHQRMPHKAELRLLARPLAIKPRFRIGGRGVRLVRALLAMEIRLAVPPAAAGGSPEPSFGRKLFIDAQASTSVPSTEK
jgi:hypothetical protein